MLEKPLFPTMFYETEVPKDLCLSVLDEIKQKQDMINTVSEATQIHPVSDYATDFVHSIHIETFWDQVIPFLQNEWQKYGVMMANVNSWVSCYTGPAGHHPLHNHKHLPNTVYTTDTKKQASHKKLEINSTIFSSKVK